MASSTTVPMTSTRAKSVIRFSEKPTSIMKAKVPISETKIPTKGIKVDLKSCRNNNTMRTTSTIASKRVFITSCIEA